MPEQVISPTTQEPTANPDTSARLPAAAREELDVPERQRQAEAELYRLATALSRGLESEQSSRHRAGDEENMFEFMVSSIPSSLSYSRALQEERFMILRQKNNMISIDLPRPEPGRTGVPQLRSEPEILPYNQRLAQETERPLRTLYQLCANMKPEELPSPGICTSRPNALNRSSCFVFPCYDHSEKRFDGVIIVPAFELDSLRSRAYSRMYFDREDSSSTSLKTGVFEDISYEDPNTKKEVPARVLLAPENGKLIQEVNGGWYVTNLRDDIRQLPKTRVEQFKARNREIDTWNSQAAAYNSHQSSVKHYLPIFFERPPNPGTQPSSQINWSTLETLYKKRTGVPEAPRTFYPSSKWRLDQKTGTFQRI